MSKKINIAIVGCGSRIAQKHFQAILDNIADFNLVAVCDAFEESAKRVSEQYKTPFFIDMETMLKSDIAIDVVSLCTPSGLHAKQSILASSYGKAVITEKPMACNVTDAKSMIIAAAKNKTRLFVVKQNRLTPTIQALKKAIVNGDFGKIYMAHSNVFWTRPQAYYDAASWRGTKAFDGGAFMNQASHYVDLLAYLMGPIQSVQAMTRTLGRKIEVEDTGVVNIAWENGAIGSMSVTMLTYPKNLEGSITIIGEKGTVQLDGPGLSDVKHWSFENANVFPVENSGFSADREFSNGHGPYYKNVADVMLRGEKAVSDGISGIKSIELLEAIANSAGNNKTINLSNSSLEKIMAEKVDISV